MTAAAHKRREYFRLFYPLVKNVDVRRAILLMGPRRVGKTVLIQHAIQALLNDGVSPTNVCYISVDQPIYNGLHLEDLVAQFTKETRTENTAEQQFVFFDEIQYLREWEVHLKTLVDSRPNIRFVVSGSAAAALRLKSNESGAGRFTDFLLPPLTFHEYLALLDKTTLAGGADDEAQETLFAVEPDITALNDAFIQYLNFGGYPELATSSAIQADPARFIKGDIVDKVLLRDLPSLYGIQDIQELNYLFTTLAYNTAQEVSLDELSKRSGVAKNTVRRYIEYLEAAFLIKVVHRIDRNGKRFQRANFFKVYLTNPSIRSALFSSIDADDAVVGALAETGIMSQWFHLTSPRYYARWKDGEVDIVGLDQIMQKPMWAVEVKWSDRAAGDPRVLRNLLTFCKANNLRQASVTTRTTATLQVIDGVELEFLPTSLYCYRLGYNLVAKRRQ